MALQATNLFIQAAPLPATFKGTPQDWSTALVQRMKILSPNGTNFIFIGDVEPTSNVGPWLKNGTQWWVWSSQVNQYVPLDISASFTIPFWIGSSTPTSSTPDVWLQTTQDATDTNPSHGDPVGWLTWNGAAWEPFVGIVLSGPTANRFANPANYQLFYDTDISTLIWWERGAWRTVDGVPGDVKFVTSQTLTGALTQNPGWVLFGQSNNTLFGRYISAATADGQGSQTVLTPPTGVPAHNAFDTYGETNYVVISGSGTVVYPPTVALWCLVKS